MKPLKRKKSITLDEDIITKIEELAEEDNRSFSQYINMVLADWIRNTEQVPDYTTVKPLNNQSRILHEEKISPDHKK
ncbi:hypothetical protein M2454_000473 [Aequitasia blattaphilus]|uniref:hypothetical protein n=1 Tax=Aequitasia blattaphilus TaxID=2949332 RepID=UPI00291696F4|nr:hypothetical protein [Aequitasia blattaphilus]